MGPDERAFRADLAKGAFRLGAGDEKWRLESIQWPVVFIAVRASDMRWFTLRFDCTNYPSGLPTACLWDRERAAKLAFDLWPKSLGGRVGAVFNPSWKDGTALYLPCDREAMAGHDASLMTLPELVSRPAAGIVQYLEIVYELLNSYDYAAPAVSAP